MDRNSYILVALTLSTILISRCIGTGETRSPTATGPPPTETRERQTYRSDEGRFSLLYPADWSIESEGYQSIVLTPPEETSWQPSTPADIPRDPRVTIEWGGYIRERVGPAHFPERIDPDRLRTWLERKVDSGTAQTLVERTIDRSLAFEITEIYDPGCEQVVYWRPLSLSDLVKVSTGCQSPYLDEFRQIADSVQQTR